MKPPLGLGPLPWEEGGPLATVSSAAAGRVRAVPFVMELRERSNKGPGCRDEEKSSKQSWNVIDNKSLLFLEVAESWNVYENKQVTQKSWNVIDK